VNLNEPKRYLAEINVVPLVDVVLVLLIIFMVTAPLLYRGIDLNLPKTEANTIKASEGKTITVTRDREILLDSRPVSLRELERNLSGIKTRNPEAYFFLRADRDVPYGFVMRVLDVIKKAGIDRLGMVSESESSQITPQ
jgi:biopolymer transport protein TolR